MKLARIRMKTLSSTLAISFAVLSLTGSALAQTDDTQADSTPAQPRFTVLAPKPSPNLVPPATVLPTWNGSFTFGTATFRYNMVGTAPSSNTSTTIPVFIIPLKIITTSSTGVKAVFNPSHVLSNGKTVVQNTVDSPIFDATTTYTQGGTNVGTTQYIDAFQRANFWGTVSTHPNYHLLLGGPTVLAQQTLRPPASQGRTGKPFGVRAAEVNINWFDTQINSIMRSFSQIQPNTLPVFLVYDTYLTQGGCCIGGYHSAAGAQSYAVFSYVDTVGVFSQDVSALSHEIGEWADDPLVSNSGNNTPCGILEVGDPLEINANFGGFGYSVNGFLYNLQDLVTLPYFGAPASTSVNGFSTFQGEPLTVCQNGA